jgi:hypothetical protein
MGMTLPKLTINPFPPIDWAPTWQGEEVRFVSLTPFSFLCLPVIELSARVMAITKNAIYRQNDAHV